MNRRRTILGLIVAALIGAFPAAAAGSSPPPAAPALFAQVSQLNQVAELLGRRSSPPDPRRGPSFSLLKFRNQDGYVISVLASQQTVALRVARDYGRGPRPRPTLSTTYVAHGKATPTSIEASFGDRGRISLRFRPSRRDVRATRKAGCKRSSGLPVAHLGFFVGELRFRGEGNYTSAQVHRVRGGSIDLAALIACLVGGRSPGRNALLPSATLPIHLRGFGIGARRHGGASGTPGVRTHPSAGPERTVLVSNHKLPLSRTIFAAQAREARRTRFLAFEAGSEGSIGIARMASVSAPESAFTFNDSLSQAAVDPPSPFAGTAAFDHGPGDAKSWTGSLAVSFLGEPHLPLAGSLFETQLVGVP